VGIQVLYQSVLKFRLPSAESPDMTAAWTAVFCAIIMYLVYLYNIRLARKINSTAMMNVHIHIEPYDVSENH
jgi:divalent metal cation (Fe/Co/Zn/Cd) transporter